VIWVGLKKDGLIVSVEDRINPNINLKDILLTIKRRKK
jgi:hypothetical protein